MTKFSIVVPVYNVEKYIRNCIMSLINQTLKDIEIILVDDGSSDNSGAICDEFAVQDSRIRVIHKKNEGVSAARNDGLKVAKGEYIIFVDSDDWVPTDAYEKMYNAAIKNNADIVIGDVYKTEDGRDEYTQFYESEFTTCDRKLLDKMIQADFYRTYCPMPASRGLAFGYGGPWNKAVKVSLLKENNIIFDLRVKGIFDDIIYTAYILANAKCVSYITEPVYYYRIINTSLTRTYKKNILEINSAIFTAWEEFITKYGQDNQFTKPYYANVVRRLTESLPIYFFSKNNKQKLSERLNNLKQVIGSEPYKMAAQNADINKLSNYQAAIMKMMRKESAIGIWFIFKAKIIIKKILKK